MPEKVIEHDNENVSLNKVAAIINLLGHPVRLSIIQILYNQNGASWSQLTEWLEKNLGIQLNPNTINFHLTKLVQGKLVEKKGTDNYQVTADMRDNPILKIAINELKRRET